MPEVYRLHNKSQSLRFTAFCTFAVILGCLSDLLAAQSCPKACATCATQNGQIVCLTCNPDSYYQSGDYCWKCRSTCKSCDSYLTCTSCQSGYFLTQNNTCEFGSAPSKPKSSQNSSTFLILGYPLGHTVLIILFVVAGLLLCTVPCCICGCIRRITAQVQARDNFYARRFAKPPHPEALSLQPEQPPIGSVAKDWHIAAPSTENLIPKVVQLPPLGPYQLQARPVDEHPLFNAGTVVEDSVVVAPPPLSRVEVPNPPIDKDQANPPPPVEVPEKV